eukprot:2920388-Prymnesium_polylepis.1
MRATVAQPRSQPLARSWREQPQQTTMGVRADSPLRNTHTCVDTRTEDRHCCVHFTPTAEATRKRGPARAGTDRHARTGTHGPARGASNPPQALAPHAAPRR